MEYHELTKCFPRADFDRVFSWERCDIDAEFLGFTDQYKALASIIPKNRIIFDFGCAYAPQCYYFKDHKKYIGVEVDNCEQFKMDNTEHYHMSIQKFIAEELPKFDIEHTPCFAICNYVPDEKAVELVRKTFKDVFAFYPRGTIFD